MYPTLRSQFLLDPNVIYLNHGSFGATPRPVFESYQRWQCELERQPTEFLGRRAPNLLHESRAVLAQFLGTMPENLAYVANATYGLNVVARSLRLGPDDEVVATDHEYGALDRTWRFLSSKLGFKYINTPIPVPVRTAGEFVETVWKGVTPRTRVIFLSHITSPTALIFPVAEVCRRARAEGILTIVDGAHAPGQIPLALDSLGADYYSGNLHKWLCAPKGAAFLYARSEHIAEIEPLVVSWGYESAAPGPSRLVDYVEWQGTRDIAAFLAVPDAIAFQAQHAWEAVRAGCHQLAVDTVRGICERTGLEPISPLTPEWIGQMAVAPLPTASPAGETELLHNALYERYRIEIPLIDWNQRRLARVSIQAYNTPTDVQALQKGLEALGALETLVSARPAEV
jgi:isopenicillin-N epimerase